MRRVTAAAMIGSDQSSACKVSTYILEIAAGGALRHGDSKPAISIVVDGLVRAFLKAPSGRQVTVRYARPGETLGLVQLLRGKLDIHAQAVTPLVLCALSPRRLRELALASAPLALAIT